MGFKVRKNRTWSVFGVIKNCYVHFARWDEHFEKEEYLINLDTWYFCNYVQIEFSEVFNELSSYLNLNEGWFLPEEEYLGLYGKDYTATKSS